MKGDTANGLGLEGHELIICLILMVINITNFTHLKATLHVQLKTYHQDLLSLSVTRQIHIGKKYMVVHTCNPRTQTAEAGGLIYSKSTQAI